MRFPPLYYYCAIAALQNKEIAPVAAAEVFSVGPEFRVLLRVLPAREKRGRRRYTIRVD